MCPEILSHSKSGLLIKGLAIIDDQSTISLVESSILTKLNIPQEDLTPDILTIGTVNGIHQQETIIIKNLVITPFNGDASISLECAHTCHRMPDTLKDVPSPQEVLSIPGLSHLAE